MQIMNIHEMRRIMPHFPRAWAVTGSRVKLLLGYK